MPPLRIYQCLSNSLLLSTGELLITISFYIARSQEQKMVRGYSYWFVRIYGDMRQSVKDLEMTIYSISINTVTNTSFGLADFKVIFKAVLMKLIKRSHIALICEANGGLNFHTTPFKESSSDTKL